MMRKKSASIIPKKETVQSFRQESIPQSMSFKLIAILLLLLAGIVWFGFYATHTKEISGSDDREYASIAGNIVNGRGIVRNLIYPVDINFFEKLPVPEFMHPPGYPLILAGFFKLFGVSEFAALLPSYLSYFILIGLFLYFAKRYLDDTTTVIAGLILIFNKEILDASLVALSEALYMLAFFLFFFVLVNAKSLRSVFIAGILLGVSHLIRENIYPLLIPVVVYLYFYPDLPRWKKIFFFFIGALILILPNMIRSYLDAGSFFFSYGKFALMAFSEKYPWLNVYREVQNPSLLEFLMDNPGQFFQKYVSNIMNALEQFVSISNPYVLAFFILGMFHWSVSPEWKRIKLLFLFLFISQTLFIALFTYTPRYFIPFLPVLIAFGSETFVGVSRNLISNAKLNWRRRVRSATIIIFLIFFIIPTTYTIFRPGKPAALSFKTPQFGFLIPREEARKLNDFLKGELDASKVIWTDLPEILEWEGGRQSGWLPTKAEHLYEIQKKIPVDAILLTNVRTPTHMEEVWKVLLFSEHSLHQYRNVKLYKGGMLYAKLLIRDGRD